MLVLWLKEVCAILFPGEKKHGETHTASQCDSIHWMGPTESFLCTGEFLW